MHFDLHPDSYRMESKKIKEKKVKNGHDFFLSNKYTNLKMHINMQPLHIFHNCDIQDILRWNAKEENFIFMAFLVLLKVGERDSM